MRMANCSQTSGPDVTVGVYQLISITPALAPLAMQNRAACIPRRRRPSSVAKASWRGRVAAPMFPVRWKVGTMASVRIPRRSQKVRTKGTDGWWTQTRPSS